MTLNQKKKSIILNWANLKSEILTPSNIKFIEPKCGNCEQFVPPIYCLGDDSKMYADENEKLSSSKCRFYEF